MAKIKKIMAREILDSRGIPTIEGKLILDNDRYVTAIAPSGESIGKYEGFELRDNDADTYNGLGVKKAVSYINDLIGPKLIGISCEKQIEIDYWLMKIDPTENRNQIGVNTMLTISQLVLKAAAVDAGLPYYKYVHLLCNKLFNNPFQIQKMPSPIFNIINGGKHGVKNLEFQEFQIIPPTSLKFSQALQTAVELYHSFKKLLDYRNAGIAVSEEGGFTPFLLSNHDALLLIREGIGQQNKLLGVDMFIGLDLAASNYYKDGKYIIKDKKNGLKTEEYINYIIELSSEFKMLILEDPIEQEDFVNWKNINQKAGNNAYVVADDFVSGNKTRLLKAIKENACSGVLLKFNQKGTIAEIIETINLAKQANLKIVFSHRLGETNDSFIADFAVGVQADFVKFGAPSRGERVAKYNRLLEIETELCI